MTTFHYVIAHIIIISKLYVYVGERKLVQHCVKGYQRIFLRAIFSWIFSPIFL